MSTDIELHPVLREILSQPGNPDATPVERQSTAEAREEFEQDIAAVDGEKPNVAHSEEFSIDGAAGPLAARVYVPDSRRDSEAPALMIYFHGGGNIRGSIRTHDSTTRVLCNAGPYIVISCSYRLAPENPYPAAIDDAMAVLEQRDALAERFGADPNTLVIAGDSAGGNIAAAAALRMRDEGKRPASAQLLIYPVIDHLAKTRSRAQYSKGYMLDSMDFYTQSYLPNTEHRSQPYASPLHAESHAELPPAVVLSAGFDPLCDEDQAYADLLEGSGVMVKRLHYPEMIHGFTLLRGLLEEADEALAACAGEINRLLGRG